MFTLRGVETNWQMESTVIIIVHFVCHMARRSLQDQIGCVYSVRMTPVLWMNTMRNTLTSINMCFVLYDGQVRANGVADNDDDWSIASKQKSAIDVVT